MSTENPLLKMEGLPAFSKISPENITPAIEQILSESRATIQSLLNNEIYSWDNLVQPLEVVEDQLGRAWSPVSHMNSVVNNDALRDAYNQCLPLLSDYSTEVSQNAQLYNAFVSIAESPEYSLLDTAQKKVINNALRDFRLSGVALPTAEKTRYKEIMQALSQLNSKFSENVLDATNSWSKHITDQSELVGLPDSALELCKQIAQQKELDGYALTLDFPSFHAVMTYADNSQLRYEMYEAYVTRASDQGPHSKEYDNSKIMEEILSLRHELAQLLNFDNYAEYSIATKMSPSTDMVLEFLTDLAKRSLPFAQQDLAQLQKYSKEQHQHDTLEAWDVAYYSEKQRQDLFNFSQEEVKAYFPENKVLDGLFTIVNRLYGITVTEQQGVDTWHPDVRFFSITDQGSALRGQFYLDLYARPHKRGGAWMDECIGRMEKTDGIQYPVAYLVCNFTPPITGKSALFTHDEVLTLFHEFGHGLHHMLTQINYSSVSGISGVAWDAVELPSQFMENWCWDRESLSLISGHYETGESLPDTLFDKMLAAKNHQSGMQMMRQLEFSLFDFRMHAEYDPQNSENIYQVLQQVRDEVAVMQPPSFNRFPHSFSHIFSGGYAAGYYSYKWAEVLSSDAFSLFEENGIFDRQTGERFLSCILEQGGSKEPMELFVEFRGREPSIDALLRHSGITAEAS